MKYLLAILLFGPLFLQAQRNKNMNDYSIGYHIDKGSDTIFPIRKTHFIVNGNFYFRNYKTYIPEYLPVPQVLYFDKLTNVKTYSPRKIENMKNMANFQMRVSLFVSAIGVGMASLILADAISKNDYNTALVGVPFGIGITTGGIYLFKNAVKKKNIYYLYKSAKEVKL
jgi:hypothetical protein